MDVISGGSRISQTGAPTPEFGVNGKMFTENCMKMKEIWPMGVGWGLGGGGERF